MYGDKFSFTCLRRSPKIRYIAISAHDIAFPVTPLGILATLIPNFVAASMSTPSIIKFKNIYFFKRKKRKEKKRQKYTLKVKNMVTTFKANAVLHYEFHLACARYQIKIKFHHFRNTHVVVGYNFRYIHHWNDIKLQILNK